MTTSTSSSGDAHQQAIAENKRAFDEAFAQKYEKRESQILLSYLFVKHMLEFDLSVPVKRKSLEESEPVLGDAHLPLNGFTKENTLPDVDTYLDKFTNSIFRPGMKILDFACGTGMVTELLVPYLTNKSGDDVKSEIVGIDIGTKVRFPSKLPKHDPRPRHQDLKNQKKYLIDARLEQQAPYRY